jgi:hypothetical protein
MLPVTDPLSVLQMIHESIWNSDGIILTEKIRNSKKNLP